MLMSDPSALEAERRCRLTSSNSHRFGMAATVLVRASRDAAEGEEHFDLGMLARLVWGEKSILRDVAIGSVTVTILSVLPVLMIMTTLNTVVMYHSLNTLTLIVVVLFVALVFEMFVTWSRRIL